MKNSLKMSFVLGLALTALTATSNAQTVAMNGAGSSALFLELGLAASSATTATPAGLGATCLWTGAGATLTDTSITGSTLTDTGNAFVAWQPGTGTCAVPAGTFNIYAYLQTDSVVGNRCLFNGAKCTVKYPVTDPAPANLILSSGEVNLPVVVATALSGGSALPGLSLDTAGSDIRPEDAEFAVKRAIAPCATPVVTGSQYLGLGYTNGTKINSFFSTSTFNVIDFTLPANYYATVLGATPVVVVANSPSSTTGFNDGVAGFNISSATLAKFLDGTYSYADQTATTPAAAGSPVYTLIREPLSGTYNTMEYNVPDTVSRKTSQDVASTTYQPAAQVNCSATLATLNPTATSNPMNIPTPSTGARQRTIGTGQELSEVITLSNATNNKTALGYGFWSVSNYKGFTSTAAPNAKYLTIDGIDPLYTTGHTYTGTIPTAAADLANVTLNNVANGSYPIWSALRLVNASATPSAAVSALATASQNFVPTGTTSARPDFVAAINLSAVHSHFIPPAGSIQPTTAANGQGINYPSSVCTSPELGGDVGGFVYALSTDSTYCANTGKTTGHTGQRK